MFIVGMISTLCLNVFGIVMMMVVAVVVIMYFLHSNPQVLLKHGAGKVSQSFAISVSRGL